MAIVRLSTAGPPKLPHADQFAQKQVPRGCSQPACRPVSVHGECLNIMVAFDDLIRNGGNDG